MKVSNLIKSLSLLMNKYGDVSVYHVSTDWEVRDLGIILPEGDNGDISHIEIADIETQRSVL